MNDFLNPLEHPVCLDMPLLNELSAWSGHVPFAMWLMSAARPRTFVELGVYKGVSFSAFNQAAKTLQLATHCYGVDTWTGDHHIGHYGPEVLYNLETYHHANYHDRSTLMRMTFDKALAEFSDGSVDLLHIDGFHSYAAVKCDFDSWLPKMSDYGIVVFHDIHVREHGFGVYRLWNELIMRYPNHFDFTHCHGLGVLLVGSRMPNDVHTLFNASAYTQRTEAVRKFFHELGVRTEAVLRLNK